MFTMKGIKFCTDIVKTQTPFIPIGIDDIHFVAMLIDTGSTDNLIFSNAYEEIKNMFSITNKQSFTFGIEGKETILNIVSADFYVCGVKQRMEFQIANDTTAKMLSKEVGLPVCGVIGSNYMLEHGWIIDYNQQAVLISK